MGGLNRSVTSKSGAAAIQGRIQLWCGKQVGCGNNSREDSIMVRQASRVRQQFRGGLNRGAANKQIRCGSNSEEDSIVVQQTSRSGAAAIQKKTHSSWCGSKLVAAAIRARTLNRGTTSKSDAAAIQGMTQSWCRKCQIRCGSNSGEDSIVVRQASRVRQQFRRGLTLRGVATIWGRT